MLNENTVTTIAYDISFFNTFENIIDKQSPKNIILLDELDPYLINVHIIVIINNKKYTHIFL